MCGKNVFVRVQSAWKRRFLILVPLRQKAGIVLLCRWKQLASQQIDLNQVPHQSYATLYMWASGFCVNKRPRTLKRFNEFVLYLFTLMMEKDKEAMALLQNKRQEFRCNLVLKAVNKEQNIRERELSHESSQFKVRLQKLIQKRKELNLDPMKTRELELFLNPGLKNKVVCQSPLRKVSPDTIHESQFTKEIDNKTFVTKMKQESNSSDQISDEKRATVKEHETKQRDCNNGENTRGQGGTDDTTRSPLIPPLDRAQKQYSKISQSLNSNNANSTSDAAVETMPSKGGKSLSFTEKGAKGDPEMTDLKARALKRSASNLQLKIGNVQQWLEEMDNANDSKFIYKRFSTSS